jgi:hypothetical protein
MRRWVCLLWICTYSMLLKNSSLYIIYKFSASTAFAKQTMSILQVLCYNGSLVTWTVVSLTTAKFKPLYFLRLVSPFPMQRTYWFSWFVWILFVAWTILLYNHIHKEGWKLCANRGAVCTLENFQWCVEPYFVGAAILRLGCLTLIPRRDKRKPLLISLVPLWSFSIVLALKH